MTEKLKSISLFAGAGGMDVGVKDAGFKILAASELDPHACNTFRANHKDTKLFEGDINDHHDSLEKYKNIDLIFGGPPCQGFSVAGKMDPKDPRSSLVFSFCDVVKSIPIGFIPQSNAKCDMVKPNLIEIISKMKNNEKNEWKRKCLYMIFKNEKKSE